MLYLLKVPSLTWKSGCGFHFSFSMKRLFHSIFHKEGKKSNDPYSRNMWFFLIIIIPREAPSREVYNLVEREARVYQNCQAFFPKIGFARREARGPHTRLTPLGRVWREKKPSSSFPNNEFIPSKGLKNFAKLSKSVDKSTLFLWITVHCICIFLMVYEYQTLIQSTN